MLVTTN
jgi:hypothetical protein